MSWKLFGSTFLAVFIAEMGDKTQLAAFGISGGASSRWTVFIAASLALVASTAIAVVAGGWVSRHVPLVWIKRGAGVIFIVLGVLFVLTKEEPAIDPPAADPPTPEQPA